MTKELVLTKYQAEVILVNGIKEWCKPFNWIDESQVTDSMAYLQVGLKSFETFDGWIIPITSVLKYRIVQYNKMLCSINVRSGRTFYTEDEIARFIKYVD